MPNSEVGVMFVETDVFPKEYYIKTHNEKIIMNSGVREPRALA
jgi:hypothetical protein